VGKELLIYRGSKLATHKKDKERKKRPNVIIDASKCVGTKLMRSYVLFLLIFS
jgi:hypothetical protein